MTLAEVADLLQRELRKHFELERAEGLFDQDKTRATANLIRRTSRAQGVLVPPLGCPDRPDTLNLVVFLDRFVMATSFIMSVERAGTFAFLPATEKGEGTEQPLEKGRYLSQRFQAFAINQVQQLQRGTIGVLLSLLLFLNCREAGVEVGGKDSLALDRSLPRRLCERSPTSGG